MTQVERDFRHNRTLKQELRRYGPRSIFPQESPFRALFGAFYPHPAHKSSPRAEWATHTGHCAPASHPTPNQRGEVVRRPSPAGCCLPPTAEFPMNFPARSRGRGPLVGHWSGRRWHNFPFPGSWSGTRCGGVIYGGQPITAPDRRAPHNELRYGRPQRLPGNEIVAQSTGLLS